MRLRTVATIAVLASTLREREVTTTCAVSAAPRETLWVIDLPVTPAFAGPTATTTPPALKELEGDWDGTLTLSSVSSSIKQVETMMAPYVGPARPLRAAATPASGGVEMTFEAGGSPFECPFVFTPGRLTCDTVVNTHRMHWEGSVTRAGSMLQIAGTWTATHPLMRMSGRWALSKPAESDVDIELVHVAGKSPKVFVTGWPFGARCLKAKGTKDEQDISKSAAWSGTGTFDPPSGERVLSHFAGIGANRITISCGDAKRTFRVETVSTQHFARLGDRAQSEADAHGCMACPHKVVGPLVTGSPTVRIDDRPAARVGDRGMHAACCGVNTFTVTTGSDEVFIDGRPAAKMKTSRTAHCGGQGILIDGSMGGNEPFSPTSRAGTGGIFGIPLGGGPGVGGGTGGGGGPKPAGRGGQAPKSSAPATSAVGTTVPGLPLPGPTPIIDGVGAIETSLVTGAEEVKVLRNTLPGAKAPTASVAVLPASSIYRKPDGAITVQTGAVVVTTFGGKQIVNVPEGQITLGSQARIARFGDGVDIAVLSGAAQVTPTNGTPFSVAEGLRLRFDAKGPKAAPTKMSYEDVSKTFTSLVDPKKGVDRAPPGLFSRIPGWVFAALGGVVTVLVGVAFLVFVLATRRSKTVPTR